jgi:hypothetical protein
MIKTISRQLRRLVHGTRPPVVPELPRTPVLDYYVREAPHPRNIAALFKGQWLSKLPEEIGFADGTHPLFVDDRIERILHQVDITGCDVLELGPLEGGHTQLLHNAGAKSITAIESNSMSYLRCLAVKEMLGLNNARFLLGDFVEYLRERRHSFDVALAFGVLYHMQNPVELLDLLSHACRQHLFLWTHYYAPAGHSQFPDASAHFREPQVCSWKGFRHSLVQYNYDSALDSSGFCGGTAPFSFWMLREDLLAALEYFGFREVTVLSENPYHKHGPELCLIASR